MKIKTGLVLVLPLLLLLAGCYKQVPEETLLEPQAIRVVAMNAQTPAGNEADIIVMTHIKKASYYLSPRSPETPYTFTLSIDGRSFVESVKGREETRAHSMAEKGRGIHYVLKKRLRVRPGVYEVTLKAEDGPSAKITRKFKGGDVYVIRFEPVYGPRRFLRPKRFSEGIIDLSVDLTVRDSKGRELLD